MTIIGGEADSYERGTPVETGSQSQLCLPRVDRLFSG